jgi:large subunit ribosomal protein L21
MTRQMPRKHWLWGTSAARGHLRFHPKPILKDCFFKNLKAAPKGAGKKDEMYAVIKTGGKQYRVAAKDKITIEKLDGAPGDQVTFSDVLMVANGGSVEIGAPLVSGATVVGEIAGQQKSDTVYIFKKRRRKHHRRRNGHRQLMTAVTITEILTGGAKPTAKAKAEKPAKAETKAKTEAEPEATTTPAKAAAKAASKTEAKAEKKPSSRAKKPAKE